MERQQLRRPLLTHLLLLLSRTSYQMRPQNLLQNLQNPLLAIDTSTSGREAFRSTIPDKRANGTVGDFTVAVPSQAGEGGDSEAYVADTTWGEGTWKELVKLKEDMFWARIGGLRWTVVFRLRVKTVGPAVDLSAKRNTSHTGKNRTIQ